MLNSLDTPIFLQSTNNDSFHDKSFAYSNENIQIINNLDESKLLN